MKKLLLLLLCVPLIGLGQKIGCISGDCENGYGTYVISLGNSSIYEKERRYVGNFKDGLFHGRGSYTFSNGDKYVGEFYGDRIHGQGTMTYDNGDKYVGNWEDNKSTEHSMYHGKGTYTRSDGEIFEGLWENGMFIGKE